MDAYNESKQKAEEAVIAANGKDGLLTVALRPAGIFGYVLLALYVLCSFNSFAGPATDK